MPTHQEFIDALNEACTRKYNNSGAADALAKVPYDRINTIMRNLPSTAYNAFDTLLKDTEYKTVYDKIAFTRTDEEDKITLTISKDQCDLMNHLDLVIPIEHPNIMLRDYIHSVEVYFAGLRIDKLDYFEHQTKINSHIFR